MFGRFHYQNLPDFIKQTALLLLLPVLIKDGWERCILTLGGCLQRKKKDSAVFPRSQGSIVRAHAGQWGIHVLLQQVPLL